MPTIQQRQPLRRQRPLRIHRNHRPLLDKQRTLPRAPPRGVQQGHLLHVLKPMSQPLLHGHDLRGIPLHHSLHSPNSATPMLAPHPLVHNHPRNARRRRSPVRRQAVPQIAHRTRKTRVVPCYQSALVHELLVTVVAVPVRVVEEPVELPVEVHELPAELGYVALERRDERGDGGFGGCGDVG